MEEVYEIEKRARKVHRRKAVEKFFEAMKWAAIVTDGDRVVSIALAAEFPEEEAYPYVDKIGKCTGIYELKDISNDLTAKKLIAKHMYDLGGSLRFFDNDLMTLYYAAINYVN